MPGFQPRETANNTAIDFGRNATGCTTPNHAALDTQKAVKIVEE
jgi:hypothetical protein